MISFTVSLLAYSKTSAADLAARGYAYTFADYQAEYKKNYMVEELPQREAAFDRALAEMTV